MCASAEDAGVEAQEQAGPCEDGAAAPEAPDEFARAIEGIIDRAARGEPRAINGLCHLMQARHRVRPDAADAADDGNRLQLKVIAGIDADLL